MSVLAFVFAFVGSLPLAGPIALLVVSNGVRGRYREAFEIAVGAAVAEGVYAFLAFWGFATLLARYELVLPISHGVTAVLLLGLGVRFVFFTVRAEPAGEDKPGRFWVGFSISALNPTLLVTWSAVTTFVFSKGPVVFEPVLAVPFGVFAAGGVAVWGAVTVGLLRRYRSQLPERVLTWVVRAMGLVLVGAAVWSGIELVRHLHDPPRHRAQALVVRGESICMHTANTSGILPAHERAPASLGLRIHRGRRVRGGRIARGAGGQRDRGR